MPSIKFVCDQDLFGLHFQDTFDTSRLNAPILLSFSNGMNTVLLQTPISYCIDSMGCLVTCFGMTGFSSWLFKPCLKQTMHYSSKALIKPIISWSDVVVFQTSPWEDKRSFMIGTPIFSFLLQQILHCGWYISVVLRCIRYTCLGGFWAINTFPPLFMSHSAFYGRYTRYETLVSTATLRGTRWMV